MPKTETSDPPAHCRDIYNSLFPAGEPVLVRTPSSCIMLDIYYILFEPEATFLFGLQTAQSKARALR